MHFEFQLPKNTVDIPGMDAFIAAMWKMTCCALVDQNRYIGDDPVGHACSERAIKTVWLKGVGFRVCNRCVTMLESEPERITFPVCRGELGEG